MGIVRPVMEAYPLAWVFFVPFILIATFTMLNLFIAVIVNAMQTLHEEERHEIEQGIQDIAENEAKAVLAELSNLRAEISALRQDVQAQKA
jgi:voltage-gated sodium channel